MPANLCCAADQRSGSSSPELPNARLSESTPARRPLLPLRGNSYGSRFTSAQSEDLHELRQIFDGAVTEYNPESPTRSGRGARTSSSSHNLQKIRSVQALIKKKLSRDLSKSRSSILTKGPPSHATGNEGDHGTVIKINRQGPNTDVKITKEDLRNDLLSDKKPEEGGYDPDAEVLDDIVKRLDRKTPTKRTSIHSIEWNTNSPTHNDGTPGSRTLQHSRDTIGVNQFHFKSLFSSSENTPGRPRMPQYSSSPNLRDKNKAKARRLRRSHSATSIEVPTTPTLQPIRLPSISSVDATPWSLSIVESLRLSAFPLPPGHPVVQEIERHSQSFEDSQRADITDMLQFEIPFKENQPPNETTDEVKNAYMSNTTTQAPVRNTETSDKENLAKYMESEEYPDLQSSSTSIHLYNMRISQHLRSASVMSSTPSCQSPRYSQHGRTRSSVSSASKHPPRVRHDRKTSSSGFASTKIPITWGQVIRTGSHDQPELERQDETSSVYSSRPQSPRDSISEPTTNVSYVFSQAETTMNTTLDLTDHAFAIVQEPSIPSKPKPSDGPSKSEPFLVGELPRPSPSSQLLESPAAMSVNSSTSSLRKVSKFKEEFSPSPPSKKGKKRKSALTFLRPRPDLHSKSEACFFDGPTDNRETSRERRLSHSLVSLKAEQATLEHNHHDTSPMWERALKAYQEERSTMFLSPNKALAVSGSPFRERSSSVGRLKAPSIPSNIDPLEIPKSSPGESPAHSPTVWGISDPFAPNSTNMKARLHGKNKSSSSLKAWSRYPSHTREQRTRSASHEDKVKTRDFAFETSSAKLTSSGSDKVRIPTGKKKKTFSGISKSSSMTFGKNFLKNYTRLFRSQSAEFRKHGHGHRSSITTGGLLDYPELEILPEVWHRGVAVAEESIELAESPAKDHDTSVEPTSIIDDTKVESLRHSDPVENQALHVDGTADVFGPTVNARAWSHFYKSCVDYPRSTSIDSDAFVLGVSESKGFLPQSETSKSLPARLKHIKNDSLVSVLSERSVSSVRRSTVDLVQSLQQVERRERERVLKMVGVNCSA
ncbi:hypothetical protein AOQ84DRAFT_422197 [Glonium stellatum]|uniref:Uncharacterized protein n=1 Tax=Glonium stellatum TaxID=574774 RepID=A0A8E2JW34_9PEZI|nr:hypothetical protein AOQ84DRAFT_422197 [Glonium stellatum]